MNRFFTLLLAASCLTAVGQKLPVGKSIEADFSKGEDVAWVDFCNESMDLSKSKRAEFWAEYRKMESDISAEKRKKRSHEMSLLNPFMTSEKAVTQAIEDIAKVKIEMISIERDFMTKLVKMLGPKSAIEFNLIEREYKRQLKAHRRQQE